VVGIMWFGILSDTRTICDVEWVFVLMGFHSDGPKSLVTHRIGAAVIYCHEGVLLS